MKKILYCLLLPAIAGSVQGQGFIKKLKDKASNAVGGNKTAAAASSSAAAEPVYTEPSKCGQAIYQLKNETDLAGDGMILLSLESAEATGNDLHAKINIDGMLYDFANGQLKATGAKFVQRSGKNFMASEKQLQSIDISSMVQYAYLTKTEPRICSGPIRGQANQTYTFNGKGLAGGVCSVVRNYDSSAIAIWGSDFSKPGQVGYFLMGSLAPRVPLPSVCLVAYLSPNGKMAVAAKQTGTGADFYLSDGRKIALTNVPGGDRMWIKNSGSIFTLDNGTKTVLRNDQPFLDLGKSRAYFDDIDLFISEDEKMAAYCNYRGPLYFTDGETYENTYGVRRLTIDNKEMLVFLAGSVKEKKLYLCRKEL